MQQQQQQDRDRENPPPPLQQQQATVSAAAAPSSAAVDLAHSTPAIAKQKQLHLPPKIASAKHCKACNANLGVGQCPKCVEFAEHPPELNHKRARIPKKNGQDEVNA